MDTAQVLQHLANFFAPAVFSAVCISLLARIFMPKRAVTVGWRTGLVIQMAVGAAVLLAALLLFGSDGKVATYAALVLCSGVTQWLLVRGWHR